MGHTKCNAFILKQLIEDKKGSVNFKIIFFLSDPSQQFLSGKKHCIQLYCQKKAGGSTIII